MFFVWPIAVPIYLLWARGRRGAVLLLIHLVPTDGLVIGVAWIMFGVMQIEPR